MTGRMFSDALTTPGDEVDAALADVWSLAEQQVNNGRDAW